MTDDERAAILAPIREAFASFNLSAWVVVDAERGTVITTFRLERDARAFRAELPADKWATTFVARIGNPDGPAELRPRPRSL